MALSGAAAPGPANAVRHAGAERCADCRDAFAGIVAATAEGELTPSEGTTMARLIEGFAAVDDAAEADRRARYRKQNGPFSDLDF